MMRKYINLNSMSFILITFFHFRRVFISTATHIWNDYIYYITHQNTHSAVVMTIPLPLQIHQISKRQPSTKHAWPITVIQSKVSHKTS